MVFPSDFGTGKTLVMKTKARDDATDASKKVYYVSLCATDYYTEPYTQALPQPTVFDMATEAQFVGAYYNDW